MSDSKHNEMVEKHLELLGYKAKDLVTGFSGVISSISFEVFGCVQALIAPPQNDKGEIPQSMWFDVTRIKVTGNKPVMQIPDFAKGYIAEGRKGASLKPSK